MRSLVKKTDHYRSDDARMKGAMAAREKYPSQLEPVEYHTNRELADEWHRGFEAETKKLQAAARVEKSVENMAKNKSSE